MAAACSGSEKMAKEPLKSNDQWMAEGYLSAMVKHDVNAEAPCNYMIEVKSMGLMEAGEIPKVFMKDGMTVWVKVVPQRRMSICQGSTPAELQDIKKRED